MFLGSNILADTGPIKEFARRLSELEEKQADDARELRDLLYRNEARGKQVRKMKDELDAMRAALSKGSREG